MNKVKVFVNYVGLDIETNPIMGLCYRIKLAVTFPKEYIHEEGDNPYFNSPTIFKSPWGNFIYTYQYSLDLSIVGTRLESEKYFVFPKNTGIDNAIRLPAGELELYY
jgi:hypothetical protein